MADYVEILEGQNNFGWVNTFDLGGKYPAVSKRVWETYDNMVAFANDYSAEGTCISGLILTVRSDSDDSKNGVYFVKSVGSADASAVLVKVGSDSEADLAALTARVGKIESSIGTIELDVQGLQEAISGKADTFTVGDGLNYSANKIDIVIDPDSSTILSKSAAGLKVTIPTVDVPEYSVTKSDSSGEYAAVYQLTKDGSPVGVAINIPKDMVIQSGDVKTVDTPDVPYSGAQVGDKYIDLVIANKSDSHLYIPVNDLVDEYTSGNSYITIDGYTITLEYDALKTQLTTDVSTAFGIGEMKSGISQNAASIATINSSLGTLTTTVGNASSGLVKDVADLKTSVGASDSSIAALDASIKSLDASMVSVITNVTKLQNAVGDASKGLVKDVTDLKTTVQSQGTRIGTLETNVSNKLDKTATVNGLTFDDSEGTPALTLYAKDVTIDTSIGTGDSYTPGTTIHAILANLDTRITSAQAGGVTGITSGNAAIVVSNDNPTNPKVTFTLSPSTDASVASIGADGLKIEDMRSKWIKLG